MTGQTPAIYAQNRGSAESNVFDSLPEAPETKDLENFKTTASSWASAFDRWIESANKRIQLMRSQPIANPTNPRKPDQVFINFQTKLNSYEIWMQQLVSVGDRVQFAALKNILNEPKEFNREKGVDFIVKMYDFKKVSSRMADLYFRALYEIDESDLTQAQKTFANYRIEVIYREKLRDLAVLARTAFNRADTHAAGICKHIAAEIAKKAASGHP